MAKMLAAFRLFIAFLLGLLFGVIGTVVMITQQWGVSDFVVSATPQVKELREGLARVEGERDQMTRRLESVAGVLQQVEKRYDDLGRRFESLEAQQRGRSAAPRTPAPPPAAQGAAPSPGSPSSGASSSGSSSGAPSSGAPSAGTPAPGSDVPGT